MNLSFSETLLLINNDYHYSEETVALCMCKDALWSFFISFCCNHVATNRKTKGANIKLTPCVSIVGVAGFEPATPCSQSRYANRTALHPDILCVSE